MTRTPLEKELDRLAEEAMDAGMIDAKDAAALVREVRLLRERVSCPASCNFNAANGVGHDGDCLRRPDRKLGSP